MSETAPVSGDLSANPRQAPTTVVVVGAGMAGARTCAALRERGFSGRIVLVGEELHPPYDRPPLSKEVLAGTREDTTLDYDLSTVEVRLGVRALGVTGRVLHTDAGDLGFDRLVVATGATPLRLPGPGPQWTLRTSDDARALRDRLVAGLRLVIVGAGWIGAEVATTAAAAGCAVTVLEAAETPLAALGPVGGLAVPWYATAGVALRCSTPVTAVESGGVRLPDGSLLAADVVLAAVGVRPATAFLAGAGVSLHHGYVAVDATLTASRPDVLAVGDAAAWMSGRYQRRVHVEHWDDALQAGDTAAATIVGIPARHDPLPYVWSSQFGHMVQCVGLVEAADRPVLRGDPGGPGWSAVWLDPSDRVRAVLAVDRPRDLVGGRRLVAAGSVVDPGRLADPAVALRDLI